MKKPIAPVEPKPANVLDDRGFVVDIFFFWVGVIEAQIAKPAEFRCDPEVQTNRLGMPDVQVAIGLGREARVHPAFVQSSGDIFVDDLLNKMPGSVMAFWVGHGGQILESKLAGQHLRRAKRLEFKGGDPPSQAGRDGTQRQRACPVLAKASVAPLRKSFTKFVGSTQNLTDNARVLGLLTRAWRQNFGRISS